MSVFHLAKSSDIFLHATLGLPESGG